MFGSAAYGARPFGYGRPGTVPVPPSSQTWTRETVQAASWSSETVQSAAWTKETVTPLT